MAVIVAWDDDTHTTIRLDYSGQWTWDEWYHAMDEAEQCIREIGHRVYFINNIGRSMYLPGNAITTFKHNAIHFSQLVLMSFVVSEGTFLQVMFNTFKSFAREWAANYYLVGTMEAARGMITQHLLESNH